MCLEMLLQCLPSSVCKAVWEMGNRHDGSIYTAEIGRHCEPGWSHPLGPALVCVRQHSTA